MNAWWRDLQANERRAVVAGSLIVVVFILYLAVWQPMENKRSRLEKRLPDQRAMVAWMQQSATQVKQLRGRGGGAGGIDASRSLISVVDKTTKQAGLGKFVRRMDPQGRSALRITLENVAFDGLIKWLGMLASGNAVQASAVVIERLPTKGLVNARITLER